MPRNCAYRSRVDLADTPQGYTPQHFGAIPK
jgi:hypothetical protein